MYKNKYHHKNLSNIKVLVTGGAGFIGSNIIEYLVKYNIGKVRILDDFSTGFKTNIEDFLRLDNVELLEGDIRELNMCQKACEGIDYVLHQAALGSVPRSINDPITTNEVNITGFLNMLVAVKDQKVKRMVYAASSSTYGDSKELPKVEERIGNPLSPYAVTKYVNELYAEVFTRTFNIETIGLRYFNVFGPKQNPNGGYAAVIPRFIKSIINDIQPQVNGDGTQSRDFTFVENVVQANIKSIFVDIIDKRSNIYNIACGENISLNGVLEQLNNIAGKNILPNYAAARLGDIKDSLADISAAKNQINYYPEFFFNEGLRKTYNWYEKNER